jgi:hypothetical protein
VNTVDLDLLFKFPQKYARIIRGKGEGASSRESTMMVYFMLKNPRKHWGRRPLLYGKLNMAIGVISHLFGLIPVKIPVQPDQNRAYKKTVQKPSGLSSVQIPV